MIKDVMVWLDGSIADEVRLAAAEDIARVFQGHIIGLFLNPCHHSYRPRGTLPALFARQS